MKLKLIISYDGSKFNGFQRQNNVRNIQGTLEKSLSDIYNEKIVVKGAGRTDAGVHAKYQVVHFITNKKISNLKEKLNKDLEDIRVKKIKKVNNSFHARHSVKNKTYLYKLDLTGKRNANYYGLYRYNLNIPKMRSVSKIFLGTHDFHNFVGGTKDNTETTIINIKIYKFNNVIYFKFKGYAFYRYMIRNLVGALIEVGKGKVDEEIIQNMLNKEDSKRLPTAKPNGLYLVKINY